MNIHHVLFFCFLSAFCGGNSGVRTYMGAEGRSGTITCYLTVSGRNKFFCKEKCKAKEDILIKTSNFRGRSGRHSLRYKQDSSGRGHLSVTFTRLNQSDSGQYRCGIGSSLVPDSYSDFEIRVSAAPLDGITGFVPTVSKGQTFTLGCKSSIYGNRKFFCKTPCKKRENILVDTNGIMAQSGRYSVEYKERSVHGLYITIAEVSMSDAGWYICGYGKPSSPDSYYKFRIHVTDDKTGLVTRSVSTLAPTSRTTQDLSAFPGNTSKSSVSLSSVPSSLVNIPLPGYFLPLVVCVPLVFVLLVVFLLVHCQLKTRNNSGSNKRGNTNNVNMENLAPGSTCEDPVYQSLDPASRDEQTYSAYQEIETK